MARKCGVCGLEPKVRLECDRRLQKGQGRASVLRWLKGQGITEIQAYQLEYHHKTHVAGSSPSPAEAHNAISQLKTNMSSDEMAEALRHISIEVINRLNGELAVEPGNVALARCLREWVDSLGSDLKNYVFEGSADNEAE